MQSAEQAQRDRSWNGERDREQKKEHVGSLAYVEDEVLVLGLEREAAAEVDAPHQHQRRRRRGQRVRRVRERRRLHAQPGRGHLARALLPPLPPPPSPGLYGGGSRSPPATDSSSIERQELRFERDLRSVWSTYGGLVLSEKGGDTDTDTE